ncbi:MAG: carboxylesterase [Pseudomonadota bacterium]
MSEILDCVEVTTGTTPEGSVVWLHGLGADGHDFEPIVPHLGINTPLRFVFPHAPVRPITINGGMSMRAWYDILAFDRNAIQDEQGIRDSAELAHALMLREVDRGIPWNKIVLAGFSQGGAITLYQSVRMKERLAGIMALSTYMPMEKHFDSESVSTNKDTPFFLAHGQYDPVLPCTMGEDAHKLLTQHGFKPQWTVYPMEHSVSMEEIADIKTWLAGVFD